MEEEIIGEYVYTGKRLSARDTILHKYEKLDGSDSFLIKSQIKKYAIGRIFKIPIEGSSVKIGRAELVGFHEDKQDLARWQAESDASQTEVDIIKQNKRKIADPIKEAIDVIKESTRGMRPAQKRIFIYKILEDLHK